MKLDDPITTSITTALQDASCWIHSPAAAASPMGSDSMDNDDDEGTAFDMDLLMLPLLDESSLLRTPKSDNCSSRRRCRRPSQLQLPSYTPSASSLARFCDDSLLPTRTNNLLTHGNHDSSRGTDPTSVVGFLQVTNGPLHHYHHHVGGGWNHREQSHRYYYGDDSPMPPALDLPDLTLTGPVREPNNNDNMRPNNSHFGCNNNPANSHVLHHV